MSIMNVTNKGKSISGQCKGFATNAVEERFQWEQKEGNDEFREVVFSADGLTASYNGDDHFHFCKIKGKRGIALPHLDDNRCFSLQMYYYEVKIGNIARRMSVGFASPLFGTHIRYLLGYGFWLENNGEMVSMDCKIQGWPSYGKDDIVGSGCLLSSSFRPATEEKSSSNNSDENAQQIQYIMLPFYTLNGQLCAGIGNDNKRVPPIPISYKAIPHGDTLKPRVCADGSFEVRANFGHEPFLYNPHKFLEEVDQDVIQGVKVKLTF